MKQPKLIILCGLPGSGKTTYAKTLKDKTENIAILSSDVIREELYGNENIQGNPTEIFSLMQERAIKYLSYGLDVIYDATNMSRKDRAGIIANCPKYVKIECHIIWASIDECKTRDSLRERKVGSEIIDRMAKRFQFPYYDEGIQNIVIIASDNINNKEYYEKILQDMKIPHDNPNHSLGILEHCIEAKNYASDHNFPTDVWMAASLHDCGKPYTKTMSIDENGKQIAHYYNHQNVGAWVACGIITDPTVLWLISTHMDLFLDTKYSRQLPNYLKELLNQLHDCNLAAH